MTLAAAILFVGISSLASVDSSFVAQSAQPSSSSARAPDSQQAAPDQSDARATQLPSEPASGTKNPSVKPNATTARKGNRRRKVSPKVTAPGPAPSVVPTETGNGQGQASSPSETPKNGPPPKIVVRQGGVSEQSIQLAGSSPRGESTQKRESTQQMLATTEENLKKVAGIQLSTDQQSSVSQIRQFVSQSKSALAAADFERAQTLAWKAKVLSDDLVNPKK